MPNPSIDIVYPNEKKMFMVPNHEKNGDYEEYTSLSHFTMNFNYTKNGKKKLFFPNQSINIMYPNDRNMIGVPITKGMGIVKSIQVCPISRRTLIIRKMVEKKAFLA